MQREESHEVPAGGNCLDVPDVIITQSKSMTWDLCKISQKLELPAQQSESCKILRVHRHLRNVNSEAYDPEVIAIGPYHQNKDNLKMMEEHKLRYLHSLLQRNNQNLSDYLLAIEPLEAEARKCYAEPISLNISEFTHMLVLDGCFIIELVQKYNSIERNNDPIFQMDWILSSLERDLMLFENQIPFFVLDTLFDLIVGPNQSKRLIDLLLKTFKNLYPAKVMYRENYGINHLNPKRINHLLHLIHNCWVHSRGNPVEYCGSKKRRRIKNTTWLRQANVRFESMKEDVTLFDIKFRNKTIQLAPLSIKDRTETFFRNLIAFEQYFQETKYRFVTDYVKFMDCLIDSSGDVEILSRCGIIDNWLGDDDAVAKMFNTLSGSVTCSGNEFIYADIFERVNNHCRKWTSRWMGWIRRKYWNSSWAILAITAAVLLLLLAIVQTVCSLMQVINQ